MRLFLIGFMCSGKSRIGKDVAVQLGLPFVDIDREIEKRVGPITPFYQKEGEEAFRALENDVLDEVIAGPDAVIATGGGTPCAGDNMAKMRASGTVVWLDVPMDVIHPRIARSGTDRPLLFGLKGEQLEQRVASLLAPRIPIYGTAHFTVMNDNIPEVAVRRILDTVNTQVR